MVSRSMPSRRSRAGPEPGAVERAAYLLLTYLLAAVPFGVVLTTLYGGDEDVRRAGSGNIGATNVARVYGAGLGIQVALLDALKGFVPVALARVLWPEAGMLWWGGVTMVAFVAHCYPVYLEFKGGKGVATAAGALLALSPQATLPAVLVWIVLLRASGKSSVAALGAAASLVGFAVYLGPSVLPVVGGLTAGILTTHVPNIRRLIRGQESTVVRPVRWGQRAETDVSVLLGQGPAGGPARPAWGAAPAPDEAS